ncbi:MAG: response regulator [Burkholderiales bacterium]|nr:response regulator [Burkholderiales bacterium]
MHPSTETNKTETQPALLLLIAALLVCVFITDFYTRLGMAEWILYIVPVGVCVFATKPMLPLYVASIASLLLLLGFVISPVGMVAELAGINRSIGFVTIWVVAIIVRQVLKARAEVQRYAWINEGHGEVSRRALGDLPPEQVGSAQLAALAHYLRAEIGALYRIEGDALLRVATHGFSGEVPERFRMGEGLVGQVARDGKPALLREVPPDYLTVRSALGQAAPRLVLVSALTADGVPYGVVELGFLHQPGDLSSSLELLERIAESMGIALRSALYRQRVLELLQQTQRQSEELQVQQEELKASNEELEEHARALKESQLRLENQQAELEQINAQLELRTNELERQKEQLLEAQSGLRDSARRLERASRYKSEFLANMSHELRTPLNSSLILAQVLADNKSGNLSEQQVNYARVIQTANQDLLALINDILDLSKIEAGHADIQPEPVALAQILERLRDGFAPQATRKGLAFEIAASPQAASVLTTDARRLEQVLRNLLSNAIKFTEAGAVTLSVAPEASGMLAFAVEDTGIGIAEEEQAAIFEAFHQADGTTSRKYGGTGLGLSISRELARLLGGAIRVQSKVGVGSTFTLVVPPEVTVESTRRATPASPPPAPAGLDWPLALSGQHSARAPRAVLPPSEVPAHIDDDRAARSRERVILVVEDDPKFAGILYGVAHDLDLDCVHTSSGAEALKLAHELEPSGIVLDVGLPDHSGLAVLERLKRDPLTRHIPVHMISVEDHTQPALELGAVGYTLKPVARDRLLQAVAALEARSGKGARKLLIVEDDAALANSIAVLLQADDLEIELAATGAQALEKLAAEAFDCIVMDLALPDASGFEILERMSAGEKFASPPVIVYTGRVLTPQDEARLRRYSRSIIVKGARSPERLLDEVSLFLHRVEAQLPPDQQKLLRQARERDAAFEGRTILLAEDDVRNVYALSSVIEPLGAKLKIARNGREALALATDAEPPDLVLMDIMMPEMDGLAAIRAIRGSAASAVPIIALTAKAMPEDRRACLDAGANDYISKPFDLDRLLSLCRVWMKK